MEDGSDIDIGVAEKLFGASLEFDPSVRLLGQIQMGASMRPWISAALVMPWCEQRRSRSTALLQAEQTLSL